MSNKEATNKGIPEVAQEGHPGLQGVEKDLLGSIDRLMLQVETNAAKSLESLRMDMENGFFGVFNAFQDFLNEPSQGLNVQSLSDYYEMATMSHSRCFRSICSSQKDHITFETAESHSQVLGNLLLSSKDFLDKLVAPSEKRDFQMDQSRFLLESPAKGSKGLSESEREISTGGLFSKISKIFRNEDSYLKADLGKDNTGMRYCDVKKK